MVENIIEKSLGRNRDFDELSDEELLIKLRDEANALLLEHQVLRRAALMSSTVAVAA